MITGCMSGSVRLWNLLEHPVVCSAAYQRHSSAVWAARVLASGDTACTAEDTALHFWAMDAARPLSVFAAAESKLKAAEAPFTSVAAVPGSATLGFCAAGMASWSLCQVSAGVSRLTSLFTYTDTLYCIFALRCICIGGCYNHGPISRRRSSLLACALFV